MLAKLVGVGIVIGAMGWSGLRKGAELSRRSAELRQLRIDLSFLEKEIGYARTPLVHAMERTARVSGFPVNILFEETCRALKRDPSMVARDAWEVGVKALAKRSCLAVEDLGVLKAIGERMGTSDVSDQVNMLRLATEELKVQEEKARQKETSEKKIWSYGGFLAGLMISILML